jgi:hypothetical protein
MCYLPDDEIPYSDWMACVGSSFLSGLYSRDSLYRTHAEEADNGLTGITTAKQLANGRFRDYVAFPSDQARQGG